MGAFAYVIQTNINCAGAVVAAAFIPLIGAATWVNADPTQSNYFNFFSITDNSNTSTFEGNEHVGTASHHFTGSFKDHDITFKYDANVPGKGNKTYNGRVNDASNQITLTSPDGLPGMTIRKQ